MGRAYNLWVLKPVVHEVTTRL